MRTSLRDMHATAERRGAIEHALQVQRRELLTEVRARVDDLWATGVTYDPPVVVDIGERCDAETQADVALVVTELKAAALKAVEDALERLEAGSYGECRDCGGRIAESRLRALPAAVRCRMCEEACEAALDHARELGRPWARGTRLGVVDGPRLLEQ